MSSTTITGPLPSSIGESTFAVMVGTGLVTLILLWGLLGGLSIQIYTYFQAFPGDKFSTKSLVCSVYIAQAIQLFLITQNVLGGFLAAFRGDSHTL